MKDWTDALKEIDKIIIFQFLSGYPFSPSSTMDAASSSRLNVEQGSYVFASAMEHPRLTKSNSTSVRLLIRFYDQYVGGVQDRARQLVMEGELCMIASRTVELNYCVNVE